MFLGVSDMYAPRSIALAGLFSRCASLSGRPEARGRYMYKNHTFLPRRRNHLSGETLKSITHLSRSKSEI